MGALEIDQSWHWAAYGKHPVARDFFRVGSDFPLIDGFANWIEKGYLSLASRKGAFCRSISWRFWARGSQKETLACGLVRDSSDSLGRSYPLLMMGTGRMNGWEEHWDLLPFAFEGAWGQMEYVSVQRFTDLKKFEGEIQNIKSPLYHWSELSMKRTGLEESESSSNPKGSTWNTGDLKKMAWGLSEKTEVFVPIDQNPSHDQLAMISLWHFLLQHETRMTPNTLFMGGTFESAFLAAFRRPLMANDFVQLWSVPFNEVKENGTRITG